MVVGGKGVGCPSRELSRAPIGAAPEDAARLWRAKTRLHIARFADIRARDNRLPPDTQHRDDRGPAATPFRASNCPDFAADSDGCRWSSAGMFAKRRNAI